MGFFAGVFGRYAIIVCIIVSVIGAAVIYVKMSSATIDGLRAEVNTLAIQTKNLQAANDMLQADVKTVQQAQEKTNQSLAGIRVAAAQAARNLTNRKYDASDIKGLNQQVNNDMAAVFRSLEQVGHAP